LTPIIGGRDSNALAKRFGGRAPIFAGEVFGDKCDGNSVIRVGPTEVSAGDEWYAHSFKIPGRDEQEMPKWRRRSLSVKAVFCVDIIEPAVSVHRHSA